MKDKVNAVAQWFVERPRRSLVIMAVLFGVGTRYLGEAIAAFVSGRPLDFEAARSGESLETGVTWASMIIAGLVIIGIGALVRHLFLRYVREP